jgi:hypothetical protein
VSSGELESPWYLLEVDGREINRVLDLAREQYSTVAVKKIVLWVGPEALEECYTQLIHYGFERAGHRETGKIPHLCFVTERPKRWKV